MQVILTKLDSIHIEDLPNGEIELQELKLWPGWTHPKFKTILTYQKGGEDYALKIVMGKVYTFEVLAQEITDALNFNDEQVITIQHNNGRVTWRIYPPPKSANPKLSSGMITFLRPHNIKLSDDIIKLFKLDGVQPDKYGIMIGAIVEKSSISFCFSNASTIFFTCDQCDKNTLVNNTKTKTITAIPVAAGIDGSLTAALTHPATLTFSNNYKNRLTFHVKDEHGNNLITQKIFCRLSINDERIYRKNLP